METLRSSLAAKEFKEHSRLSLSRRSIRPTFTATRGGSRLTSELHCKCYTCLIIYILRHTSYEAECLPRVGSSPVCFRLLGSQITPEQPLHQQWTTGHAPSGRLISFT